MELAIPVIYSIALLYVFSFSMWQLYLTLVYLRRKDLDVAPSAAGSHEPSVTIQLPIYNEKYVVKRLIDAVCCLDYPKDKLEIQLLDDSTDETTRIILDQLESLRPTSLDIKLIHRENRSGFKAGALENGLHSARGEFLAIFDADFIPDRKSVV